MKKTHLFKTSIKEGEKGEKLFLSLNQDALEHINEPYQPDFRCKKDGSLLELKSDYYNMDKTPNFFFEKYSDRDKKTLGGPWQALEKGSKWFVYFFPSNLKAFIFKTEELVNRLDKIVKGYELIPIPNKSWITEGYKIPRREVSDLSVEKNYNGVK